MKYAIALMFTVLSSQAFAAATHECGTLNNIGNLIAQKGIGDGGVKLAYVSTEEPAAAPDHLLVFVYNTEMGYSCTAVSRDADGSGFAFVDLKTVKSIGYDGAKGRLLSVGVRLPDPTGLADSQPATLKIRVNEQTGKVTLE